MGVVALVVVLAACGAEERPSRPAATTPSGPHALAALRRDANRPLGGGTEVFGARLATLRGHPVVVNERASWCGPCRYEFPFLARLARRYEDRIAFLGVNTMDADDAATAFLRRHPVPFPHFSDPDGDVARTFRDGRAFPTTAYFDRAGRLVYTHAGAYASQAALQRDVRRYARDG